MTWIFCTSDNRLLGRWQHTGISATACSAHALAALPEQALPCVCLFDAAGFDNQQLIDIIQAFDNWQFIVAVESPSPQQGVKLLSAGARGYINRLAYTDTLKAALDVVANGETWAGADTISYLLANQAESPAPARLNTAEQVLTERELQIATLVLEGLGNKEIARELEITERTVKTHLNAAFNKTGCKTRLQLALWMGQQGFTPSGLSA